LIMRISVGILLAVSAVAQTPQFEVASSKPPPPAPTSGRVRMGSSGGPGTKDPGLFTCERCSVLGLIRQAFDIQDYQISGPDWMQSTRFNISAKIAEGATRAEFRLMLRNLLVDRLKLQFHQEKKETQAYELVVAKNGPKLKESPGPLDPDERPGHIVGERKMDPEGFPILPPGRVPMEMVMSGGHATARHAEETMAEFALDLASEIGRPVSDATGLKGKYDFTIRWLGEGAGPSDDTSPNIFIALQEQLGLKLESKKITADVLVIDHIEKAPTEN
jgi:uncharacterized protein (TIGR03435 family)